MMRVLVLGAGFGGLELTTRLSDELGDAVEVMLIDKAEGFAFGFSRLDVMFGRLVADAVVHPYRDLVKPGVRFVQTTIRSIDPGQRRVETDAGSFDADVMVVALGADLDPAATPGLVEGGYEFYSMPGALAVRDVLAAFDGGRVVVGVTSTPFKCPPAPSEVALLLHDYLTDRGRRDRSEISLVTPLGAPRPGVTAGDRLPICARRGKRVFHRAAGGRRPGRPVRGRGRPSGPGGFAGPAGGAAGGAGGPLRGGRPGGAGGPGGGGPEPGRGPAGRGDRAGGRDGAAGVAGAGRGPAAGRGYLRRGAPAAARAAGRGGGRGAAARGARGAARAGGAGAVRDGRPSTGCGGGRALAGRRPPGRRAPGPDRGSPRCRAGVRLRRGCGALAAGHRAGPGPARCRRRGRDRCAAVVRAGHRRALSHWRQRARWHRCRGGLPPVRRRRRPRHRRGRPPPRRGRPGEGCAGCRAAADRGGAAAIRAGSAVIRSHPRPARLHHHLPAVR